MKAKPIKERSERELRELTQLTLQAICDRLAVIESKLQEVHTAPSASSRAARVAAEKRLAKFVRKGLF